MSTPIQIEDFRLSFIWFETKLDLLDDSNDAQTPLSFLGDRNAYAARFDEVQKSPDGINGLTTPWHINSGYRFWKRYCEKARLEDISGARAWRQLVPFQTQLPYSLTAPWFPGRLIVQSYCYPHGVALVVTAVCQTPMDLDQVVETAFSVRLNAELSVQEQGGATQMRYLNTFANDCISSLRASVFGPEAPAGQSCLAPFSIFTVVHGAGVDSEIPTPEGEEVHKALEALTTWQQLPGKPSIKETALPSTKFNHTGDGHYARQRGRAVWSPGKFLEHIPKKEPLACRHRNLMFVSLQMESLCGLTSAVAREIEAGNTLSVTLTDYSAYAVDTLARLYVGGGDKEKATFRSWIPTYQVDQNDFKHDIDRVRQLLGKGDLALTTTGNKLL